MYRLCSLQIYTVYNVPKRLGILSLYTLANSYEQEQMAALQDMLDSVLQ